MYTSARQLHSAIVDNLSAMISKQYTPHDEKHLALLGTRIIIHWQSHIETCKNYECWHYNDLNSLLSICFLGDVQSKIWYSDIEKLKISQRNIHGGKKKQRNGWSWNISHPHKWWVPVRSWTMENSRLNKWVRSVAKVHTAQPETPSLSIPDTKSVTQMETNNCWPVTEMYDGGPTFQIRSLIFSSVLMFYLSNWTYIECLIGSVLTACRGRRCPWDHRGRCHTVHARPNNTPHTQ